MSLGLYLNQLNHWVEAKEAVEPVVRLAKEKEYRRRLGQIQTVMGSYYGLVKEDFPGAFQALEEALLIGEQENDFITLIVASNWCGVLHSFDCNFEKGSRSLQRAVDINVAAKSLWGIASQKGNLGTCYFYSGRINTLAKLSSEALKIAQESGDPISRGISHTAYGMACFAKGQLKDAKKHILEGSNLLGRIGMYAWSGIAATFLAETYFEMKEYRKSRKCHYQAQRIWRTAQIMPSWARGAQLAMARCAVRVGEIDLDLDSLQAIHRRNRVKILEGCICRYLGGILLDLGGRHIPEAEQWIRKSIEADFRNGMRFNLGLDHALYAEYFNGQKDRTNAQEELGKATEILQECGADGWVAKYEKELAAIS